nr:hypothetical protein [Deltaproteobacteria bacterium]
MSARDDGSSDVKRADVHLTEIPRTAGGLRAVWSSLRHISRDSGIMRGSKALLSINQPDGFDCPGCAWPEPAAEGRSRFEFCENGAKAVAEEADTRRATPAVFEHLSLDQLRAMSDFELGQLGRLTHPMVLDPVGPGPRHFRAIEW